MAKKKENTDNKEVLGENKENSAAKTADAGAENGVASAQEKFQIKLRELLALAKKKKNMLEYQEISDFFSDMQLPFIGCQKEFKQKIKKEKHTYPKLYSEITPLINKRNIMESIHRNTYD